MSALGPKGSKSTTSMEYNYFAPPGAADVWGNEMRGGMNAWQPTALSRHLYGTGETYQAPSGYTGSYQGTRTQKRLGTAPWIPNQTSTQTPYPSQFGASPYGQLSSILSQSVGEYQDPTASKSFQIPYQNFANTAKSEYENLQAQQAGGAAKYGMVGSSGAAHQQNKGFSDYENALGKMYSDLMLGVRGGAGSMIGNTLSQMGGLASGAENMNLMPFQLRQQWLGSSPYQLAQSKQDSKTKQTGGGLIGNALGYVF